MSSTAAELEAITHAINFLTTTPSCRAVLQCDSRCALQCMARLQDYIDSTNTERRIIGLLVHRGHELHRQGVPANVWIPGNVAADALAQAARRDSDYLRPENDPWQLTRELRQYLALYKYETFGSLPFIPLKRISW